MQQLQLTQRQYLIQQGLNLPGMVMPGGDRGDRGDRERDRVGAERGKMLSHYFFYCCHPQISNRMSKIYQI